VIGLDSNVLIRYIVQDDPDQSEAASHFIGSSIRDGEVLFLNRVVLCEVVWVLDIYYGYGREVIGDTLERILNTEGFRIENSKEAWLALSDYRLGKGGFSDAFLARTNAMLGCDFTLTFDKKAARSELFELLTPRTELPES